MSLGKTDRLRADARALRDRLRGEGRNADAEIIQRLVRSFEVSTHTNAQLWRDNQKLRER